MSNKNETKYHVYSVKEEIEEYGQEKPEYRRTYDSKDLRSMFIGTLVTSGVNDMTDALRDAIDKMPDEWVADFLRVQNDEFVEKINESKNEDISDKYAKTLKDRENPDNIWVLHEFTDDLDSKDGYSYEEYTKVGLIDTINQAAEPFEGFEELSYDATNEEVIACLDYLGTNAELVRIKPYSERNF